MAQVALAWLLARPGVSTILLGASKLHQLEDNLGALRVQLTAEEVQRLEPLSAQAPYYPSWFTGMVRDSAVDKALAAGPVGSST